MKPITTEHTKVVDFVADYYDIRREDVTSKSKNWVAVRARWMICYILVKCKGLSLEQAAWEINRCESNVSYALASCEEQCSVDRSFKEQLEYLSATFK